MVAIVFNGTLIAVSCDLSGFYIEWLVEGKGTAVLDGDSCLGSVLRTCWSVLYCSDHILRGGEKEREGRVCVWRKLPRVVPATETHVIVTETALRLGRCRVLATKKTC